MASWKKTTIDDLIQRLQKEKKKGGITVAINGTLLVKETGNSVVITNQNQN